MKSKIVTLLALSFSAFAFYSCDDDSIVVTSATVNFSASEVRVTENGQGSVTIALSSAVPSQQEIVVSFDASATEYFTTTPAAVNNRIRIPVTKGSNSVMFTIAPVNNSLNDGNKVVDFSLETVPSKYTKGVKSTVRLVIEEDDNAQLNGPVADFLSLTSELNESNEEGHLVEVSLAKSELANGTIEFQLSSTAVYNRDFITEPAFVNNKLVLDVNGQSNNVSFRVRPLNNAVINDEPTVTFSIISTSGNIAKGAKLSTVVKIKDDELSGKPKGYEVLGGQWGLKRNITYFPNGDVKNIEITEAFPSERVRNESYFYNAAGRLEKVNQYPGIDLVYTWQDGRIIREDQVNHGQVTEYRLYDYDDAGNIAGVERWWRNRDGIFVKVSILVNLYYTDGNVYKTMLYSPVVGQEEPALVSTKTYENYIDAENPFPMVDILPNIKCQNKLPGKYTVEEGGHRFEFNMSYEFREDGKVSRRTARGGNISESAVYYYY